MSENPNPASEPPDPEIPPAVAPSPLLAEVVHEVMEHERHEKEEQEQEHEQS